jgi:hypothetical protein
MTEIEVPFDNEEANVDLPVTLMSEVKFGKITNDTAIVVSLTSEDTTYKDQVKTTHYYKHFIVLSKAPPHNIIGIGKAFPKNAITPGRKEWFIQKGWKVKEENNLIIFFKDTPNEKNIWELTLEGEGYATGVTYYEP